MIESLLHTETSQGVLAVDVHGTRATDTLATASAKGQSRIELVLDADDGVKHHGTGLVEIDGVALQARLLGRRVGVPAVDLERLEARLLLRLADRGHGARKGGGRAESGCPGGAEDSRRRAKCCHFFF